MCLRHGIWAISDEVYHRFSFVPGMPHAIDEPVGALTSLIYIWENASERAFHERTAAAILVLLAFMIVMNAAAILLRRRFERRW